MITSCLYNTKQMWAAPGCKTCFRLADLFVQWWLLWFWLNAYIQNIDFNWGIFFFGIGWYLLSMVMHVKLSFGRFKNVFRFLANAGTYIVASALYVLAFGFLLIPLLYTWQFCIPLLVIIYTCVCTVEVIFITVHGHHINNNTPHKNH